MKGLGLLLLLMVFDCHARSTANKSKDPLVIAFENLPDSERNDFLAYYLGRGILDSEKSQQAYFKVLNGDQDVDFVIPDSLGLPTETVQKFEAMDIPLRSIRKLLSWTEKEFGFTNENVKELLLKKKVCLPPCFEYPDIGDYCCPF